MGADHLYKPLFSDPVNTFTIVGRYEHVVAIKQLGSSSGHVFRAVNLEPYTLRVLRSSFGGKKTVRAQVIDLEAPPELMNAISALHKRAAKECPLRAYVRACSVTSQIVCFVDSDMERIAENYLAWIKQCSGIVEEPFKPTAFIIAYGQQGQREATSAAFEFFKHCTSTEERSVQHDLSRCCFQRTEVLCYPLLKRHGCQRAVVNWDLIQTMRDAATLTETKAFPSLGYQLREQTQYHLFDLSVEYFSRLDNAKQFSIARALTTGLTRVLPDGSHQNSFFVTSQATPQGEVLQGTKLSVLSLYMAHHLLAKCPQLEAENFKSSPSGETLFDFIFRQRYAPIAESISTFITENHDSTPTGWAEETKTQMLRAIMRYLAEPSCITQTHIRALGHHHDFFEKQNACQRLCSGCFFAYWDDVMPCGHGFCKACTHNYFPQWKHSGQLLIRSCLVCKMKFSEPFNARIQPPTAGGRVLSLDGGGVKGVIELEILREVSTLLGADFPLSGMFDMVVGTSIGGLIAFGLFLNRWDIKTCQSKLATLGTELFPNRPSCESRGWFGDVLRYVRYAACVAFQKSCVSTDMVQAILKNEFEEHGSILFSRAAAKAPLKVAVTTKSACESGCSIFTSYNRPPTQQQRLYSWGQQDNLGAQVTVWEAAQSTFAIPFLFPAATLLGTEFYDGALVYNNPTEIAIQEAKVFWGPVENRNLVLSIGCGRAKASAKPGEGRIAVCAQSFFGSMSASKQHDAIALRGPPVRRLDPILDIDPVSLDDVDAIPHLRQSFRSMLASDSIFKEQIRSAAFEVLASEFYVAVDLKSVRYDALAKEHIASLKIRPRTAVGSMLRLHTHETFFPLSFTVNERPMKFQMPKVVLVRLKSLHSPVDIKLTCRTNSACVSGLPSSLESLVEAETQFYRRAGSRKRRRLGISACE